MHVVVNPIHCLLVHGLLTSKETLSLPLMLISVGMCGGGLQIGGSVHQMEQPNRDVW